MKQDRDEKGRYLKGHSGNPSGRPAGERLATVAERYLSAGRKRKLIAMLYERSLSGDIAAARLLFAYHDGMPAQRIEATGSISYLQDPEWPRLRMLLLQIANEVPEVKARLLEAVGHDNG